MDLHPIFVHFPIALLVVWSLIELSFIKKWYKKLDWKSVQTVLIFAGTIGSFLAIKTGENAAKISGQALELVKWHEKMANISFFLFLIFFGEIFLEKYYKKIKILEFWPVRWILVLLAFGTLGATGMLGGVIVYGPSADPAAPYLLQLLGIK